MYSCTVAAAVVVVSVVEVPTPSAIVVLVEVVAAIGSIWSVRAYVLYPSQMKWSQL